MSNKILIIIVIILVLVAVGLAYYLVFWQKEGISGEVTSVHLEMFPEGTDIGPGQKGTETSTFKKSDLMAISGEAKLRTEKSMLTFQILDEKGEMVQGGAPGMELKASGGFGMCCIDLPNEVGKYNLKLFLDEKEAKIISFEVVE